MTEFQALISQMNSFDELELIKSQYSDISIKDFHAELSSIEKWIMSDAENPLIIQGKPLSGKKALLCSYLSYSKKKYSNFFHIACFGSLTPIYSQVLYKIMAELRNRFSVNQKVEINEEKLRRYFKYWLDITSNIIQKEYVGYNSQKKPKIIIFIEGLDLFVDNKNSHVDPQFWLPQIIPKNVRLILFTSLEAKQFKHATFYNHSLGDNKIQKLKSNLSHKDWEISKRLNLQQLKIVDKMMKKCTQLQISKLQNLKEFLQKYISCVATNNISPEQIKSILYVLSLTKKGLQKKQIKQITNVTIELFEYCLKYFDSIISQHKGCFYVLSKNIRTCIQTIVDPTLQKKKTYHQIIAKNLRKQNTSFRRLYEIIHHLMECQNFNDLKELITKIENFLLLYTPYGKNILCQCWSKLEGIEQFDPVLEYNKSVQAFNNHYYLKESELYKIVFQLCMFFKEYSDFQNFKTPCFRHPQIKGQLEQFQEINIYEELFSLNMVGKCKNYKLKKMNELGINQKRKIVKKKDIKEDSAKVTMNKLTRQEREKYLQQNHEKNKLSLEPAESLETSRPNTCDDQPSEKDNEKDNENQQNFNIQQLNLNIQTNQEKFRKFYQKSINQYLIKYFIPKKKNIKQKEHLFQSDQSDEQQKNMEKQDKDLKIEVEKIKDCLFLKVFREYEQQNYYKSSEDVKYYYYKQWIWLQFPWLCQSINHNYSLMINQCINKSIVFMSTEKQNNFIRQVLKITQLAKESKTNIYQKKKIQIHSIKLAFSKTKNNPNLNKSYIQPKNDQNIIENLNAKVKSFAKFKFDPKNIDEEIMKLRKERLKDKTNLEYLNSFENGFLTQAAEKLNYQKQARWLPVLQHSKFIKKPKIAKETENAYDSRDYTLMIRRYNEVKHQNDMLVQKIEQIKNKNTLLNQVKAEGSKQKLLNTIMELENKKKSLDYRFKNQEELQKKLKIILRICDLNKIYGSQSDHLADYLNNLKHIIQIEERKSEKIKKSINQYIDEKKKTIRQLRQNKKKLKVNLFDLKDINTNIKSKDSNLFQVQQQQHFKHLTTDKMQASQSFSNHLQNKNYQILEKKLNLKYESEDKDLLVTKFIQKFQKNQELCFINQQLKADITKARQQIEFLATISLITQGQKANNKF